MSGTRTPLEPHRLRCEYQVDPIGLGEPRPRLSWEPVGEGRGRRQTAYRLRVASSAEVLATGTGDVWDTGKVASDATFGVAYDGPALTSGKRYHWTVVLWDEHDRPSHGDARAFWEMGLLEPDAWTAQWIAVNDEAIPGVEPPGSPTESPYELGRWMEPASYLRKKFAIDAPVRRARAYVTARGLYELHLNGRVVGDEVLRPGWTDYHRRIQVQAYDVTPYLQEGVNCVGAILADGWYAGHLGFSSKQRGFLYGNRSSLLAQLHLDLEDGRTVVIGSDPSWRSSFGDILYADLLMGQKIDHRRSLGAWDAAGYDDAGWLPADPVPPTDVALVASAAPPVRVVDELEPASIEELEPGVFTVDFGQNAVGWVRLEVEGDAGTTLEVRHAEALDADGTVYLDNLRTAEQRDVFVLAGGGPEVFEPRFTFHGFRYAEVRGYPGQLTADRIRLRVVATDVPPAGSFACSNEMVNRLHSNIVWGQRGNYLSVPTDCPQRDERLGWTADAQAFLRTGTFIADVAGFFSKWMTDVTDAQSPNGAFPDVAPRIHMVRDGAPGWADAGVLVPWTLLEVYGDVRLVERLWDPMERWMDYLRRANPDFVRAHRRNNDYGDWLHVDAPTPKDLLATAFWACDAQAMAAMAQATGRDERATAYRELFEAIRLRFVDHYVSDDGTVLGDSQTGYLLALAFDLLPEGLRPKATEHLVRTIDERDGHLSTGFLGIRFLAPVLTAVGRSDLAYRLLLNETYPSWGYSIRHGATTIWERWDGWTEERGFQTPAMNSLNHYAFGSIGEWLYRSVAGIDQEPGAVAYDRILIRPQLGGDLTWARASYHGIRGVVRSAWKLEGNTFELEVEVPVNTVATVVLPARAVDAVREGGRPIPDAEGVVVHGVDEGGLVLEVGSGSYAFAVAPG